MSISPVQCKGARAMTGLSQDQLAQAAAVAKKTITDFEAGSRVPYSRTLAAIQAALEAAGVQFIPENGGGAGVRMKDRAG